MNHCIINWTQLTGGAQRCLEHINPRSVIEKWSMASEKEWLQLMGEKCLNEDARRAESNSHINPDEQK